jgi:hypothetical protein
MAGYWLNHYFPVLMQRSIEKMASFEDLRSDLTAAGFSDIQQTPFFITNDLQDWFLHAGKYRSEIYLDQSVREGISSFHLTDNHEEVEHGLEKLAVDIQSGTIQKIITDYENKIGDYLFVIGKKDA